MHHSFANALTIDVEDAISLAMRNFFGTDIVPTYRACNNTMRLLDLFDEYDVSATFFVLGEIAAAHPELVKEISGRGHEIGIHGYSHTPYYKLSKKAVREEIIKAKMLIEDITGIEVLGHRAPEFSINPGMSWVMEILIESGIKYDSSIFPVKMRRYGWTGYTKDVAWLTLEDGRRLIEVPMSTLTFFGKRIPVCGGGYLRVFPFFFTHFAFQKVQANRPVIVYLHPYEIDPPPFQQFYMDAVKMSSVKNRMQLNLYWFNRKSVLPKLNKLLNDFQFNTLRSVINDVIGPTI